MDKDKFAKLKDRPITNICPEGCNDCCLDWFEHINLTEHEYVALKDYGAKNLEMKDRRPILKLNGKCEFADNGGCKIYDKYFRPTDCKKFICFDVDNQ